MSDTKERILLTALRLFAKDGYEAVSVSDIAGDLEITKGALYRHYQNKRDIFDSIVARMERQDTARARACGVPEGSPAEMEAAYRGTSIDQLTAFAKSMFRYWTQDAFAAQFRKMLTVEQFRSAEMGALFQQYLASGPLDYVTDLLTGMGIPRARQEAAGFCAPMVFLYSIYDGAEEDSERAAVLTLADGLLDRERDRLKKIMRRKEEIT